MATRIQLRRGTAAEWTLANPVLALGEMGLEVGVALEPKFKVGDGLTAWNSLDYASAGAVAPAGSAGNLDGGTPATIYGGVPAINAGGPS